MPYQMPYRKEKIKNQRKKGKEIEGQIKKD